MKKQNVFNKALSLILSFIIIFSVFSVAVTVGSSTVVLAEDTVTKTQTTAKSAVLFESGYESAADASRWHGFFKTSQELYPTTETIMVDGVETKNHILCVDIGRSHQTGFVLLGDEYTSTKSFNSIQVGKNITYKVEFDYKLSGTFSSEFYMGLMLGTDSMGTYVKTASDGSTHEGFMRSDLMALNLTPSLMLPRDTTRNDAEYTRATFYYTVDENKDLSEFNKLLIYYYGGGTSNNIIIDNVKVTSLATYTEEVLAEEDYTNAYVKGVTTTGGTVHSASSYCAIAGDAAAIADYTGANQGTVLAYSHSSHSLGRIILGHDFATKGATTPSAGAVKPKAGETYRVSFKYYFNNGDGLLKSDILIGWAIGGSNYPCSKTSTNSAGETVTNVDYISSAAFNSTTGEVKAEMADYITSITPINFIRSADVTANYNTGWVEQTAYITIPSDFVATDYKQYLMLCARGGGNGSGYNQWRLLFDDVTVTKTSEAEVAKFSDSKTVEDYRNAYQPTVVDLKSSTSPHYHGVWDIVSGDIRPVIDPTDPTGENKALWYYCDWQTSWIALGNDYSTKKSAGTPIKVQKGVSYKIEFDYYFDGTTNGDMNIGWFLGKGTYDCCGISAAKFASYTDGNGNTITNFVDYGSIIKFPAGEYNTGWSTITAYVTIPKNADLETYGYLSLYFSGGGNKKTVVENEDGTTTKYRQWDFFIDNVAVTELAGVNVTYVAPDGGKTVKYIPSGVVENLEIIDSNGNAISWYLDKECTVPYDFDTDYTEFTEVTLYGKEKTAIKYYLNRTILNSTVPFEGTTLTYGNDEFANQLPSADEIRIASGIPTEFDDILAFDGWYTVAQDEKKAYYFDKKVNTVAEAVAAGGVVYAKWNYTEDVTTTYAIDGVDRSWYSNFWHKIYTLGTEENGNTYINYENDVYTTGKCAAILVNSTKSGYSYSNAIKTRNYAELNLGTNYKVSFRVKVTDVDAELPLNFTLCSSLLSQYWNDSCKSELVDITTISDVSNDWQEITAYFNADIMRENPANYNDLKSIGTFSDGLALVIYGVGTAQIDDFTVTAYTPESYKQIAGENSFTFNISDEFNSGVISFDGTEDFIYNKTSSTILFNSSKYEPKINGFKVNGEKVYKNPDLANGAFEGKDSGEEFVVSYNDGAADVSLELYDRKTAGEESNFSIVSATAASENALRFLIRTYAPYTDSAYLGETEYHIAERGVLMSVNREMLENADGITLGADGVYKIVCDGNIYNATDLFYDYTVKVDGITDFFDEMYVAARGYMVLTDGTNTFTVYTDNAVINSLANTKTSEGIHFDSIQLDSDLELLELGVSTVTLTMYDDGDDDKNEYGLTWISSADVSENIPVIQFVETDKNTVDFGVAEYVEIKGTYSEYTQIRCKNPEDYYNAESTGWDSSLVESYTIISNKVVLSGLKPGTTYKYRVGNKATGQYSRTGTITTPTIQEALDNSFSFVFMSDSQNYNSKENLWQITLNKAFANGEVDFIAHGGDVVQYGDVEKAWFDMIDKNSHYLMNVPIMPAGGNHDYGYTGRQKAENSYNHFNVNVADISMFETAANDYADNNSVYSGMYYSYDYENTHFVVLNTNDKDSDNTLKDTQIEWLKADLAKTDCDNIIVYMHCGLYTVSVHGSKNAATESIPLRKDLQSIFAEYGVDLVLNGHDHVYSRTNALDDYGNVATDGNGVVYVTVPAATNQRRSQIYDDGYDYGTNKHKYAAVKESYGYGWVEVNVDGNNITVNAYSGTEYNGTLLKGNQNILIDSFTVVGTK